MSEAWNNVEFIKGRPWTIISPRIFVVFVPLVSSLFSPLSLSLSLCARGHPRLSHALRIRHLNEFSASAHLISRSRGDHDFMIDILSLCNQSHFLLCARTETTSHCAANQGYANGRTYFSPRPLRDIIRIPVAFRSSIGRFSSSAFSACSSSASAPEGAIGMHHSRLAMILPVRMPLQLLFRIL